MTQLRSRKQVAFVNSASALKILATLDKMAREYKSDAGDEVEEGEDLLAYYLEWAFESLSEAGYSETDAEDRFSCRAFASILRIDAAELKTFQQHTGDEHDDYNDFGVGQILCDVLSRTPELALALALVDPGAQKATAPFSPNTKTLSLTPALPELEKWLKTLTPSRKGELNSADLNSADAKASALQLVGALRLKKSDLQEVVNKARAVGVATASELQTVVSQVVIWSLRKTPRLFTGLKWAQPKATKAE